MNDSSEKRLQDEDTAIRYEVRHYTLTQPVAQQILPLVLSVFKTIGAGSAVLTADGLQTTAPVDVLQNLVATIATYQSTPSDLQADVFYAPLLLLPGITVNVKAMVDSLGLCPPDIRCEWFLIDPANSALAFSGPAKRQAYFTSDILPGINSVIPPLSRNICYLPLITVPKGAQNLKAAIDALGLCPPDMRCALVQSGASQNSLVFSGPKQRADFFKSDVLPDINSLVNLLVSD